MGGRIPEGSAFLPFALRWLPILSRKPAIALENPPQPNNRCGSFPSFLSFENKLCCECLRFATWRYRMYLDTCNFSHPGLHPGYQQFNTCYCLSLCPGLHFTSLSSLETGSSRLRKSDGGDQPASGGKDNYLKGLGGYQFPHHQIRNSEWHQVLAHKAALLDMI